MPRPSSAQLPAGPRFSVVIPARHDAAAPGRALEHLATLRDVGLAELIPGSRGRAGPAAAARSRAARA